MILEKFGKQDEFADVLQYWMQEAGLDLLDSVLSVFKEARGDIAQTVLVMKGRGLSELENRHLQQAIEIVAGREKMLASGASWARGGLFTNKQLQQASNLSLCDYHASAFEGAGCVADICCGLGFDTAALAQVADAVVAVEEDRMVAAFALHNLRQQGIQNCFVRHATAEEFFSDDSLVHCDGVWVDPDRRAVPGIRVHTGEEYSPPLSLIPPHVGSLLAGIKVSAVFDGESLGSEWKREILGVRGETREQILWLNRDVPELQVTIVDEGFTWTSSNQNSSIESSDSIAEGEFLIEPHNALRQSNRVNEFFCEIGAQPLKGAPLGVSQQQLQSAGIRQYQVRGFSVFRPKEVNRLIKDFGWGKSVAIKKCGVSDSADKIRSSLRFCKVNEAPPDAVLFVIGIGNKKLAVFCRRVLHAR